MKAILACSLLILTGMAGLGGCTPAATAPDVAKLAPEYAGNLSTVFSTASTAINLKASPSMEADFSWKDSLGNLHSLGSLKGKVVLLNFWATWCPNCWPELPGLDSIAHDLAADSVVVIGIITDQNLSFSQFQYSVEVYGLTYQNIADTQWQIFNDWAQSQSWPQSFLIDRNGVIQTYFLGAQSKSRFENAIRALL